MKRHQKQNSKQSSGQYFTSNANNILSGLEYVVCGKPVIDPFAGNNDLLQWATINKASSIIGFDISPIHPSTIKNDSLLYPPDMKNMVVVTNPPYLSRNKSKEHAAIFNKWNESDLYKCHLASLIESECKESIQILPSNFLCESRASTRNKLFKYYSIQYAKYWDTPVFEDATTGVVVLHLIRKEIPSDDNQIFKMEYNGIIDMVLERQYGYLYGKDFFEACKDITEFDIIKTDIGMDKPNTNIIIGLLDKGTYHGLHYNDKEPLYCKPTSFTSYQITTSIVIPEELQKEIVILFNQLMKQYRGQYRSMFLANFMGPTQKILARTYAHNLIKHCYKLINQ